MPQPLRIIGLGALACLGTGCGTDSFSLSRLAYGAAAGLQQQNCMQSPMARKQDCLQTESYDDYQRKRQALGSP
jgi:hypothetical protein